MITNLLEAVRQWVLETIAEFHAIYLGYVTPQMYGAKADGTTNDTTAIRAALNNASHHPVFFPAGHYRATDLKIPSNMTIWGEKDGTVIEIINPVMNHALLCVGSAAKTNDEPPVYTDLGYHNISISDMTLRGSETFGTADGGISLLDIFGSDYIDIKNVTFQNNMYAAIRMITGCSHVTVDGCRFEACDVGVGALGQRPSSYVTVRNCLFTALSSYNTFTNNHSEQITCYHEYNVGTAYGWVVEDCVFEYKVTNVICLHEKFSDGNAANYARLAALEDRCLQREFTIRNITVRGCVGVCTMVGADNVTIDGVHVEGVDPVEEAGTFNVGRGIEVMNFCNNISITNVFIDHPDLKANVFIVKPDTNHVLIDNVHASSNVSTPVKLGGTNHKITNVVLNVFRVETDDAQKSAKVEISNLSNSYIDIKSDVRSDIVLYLDQLGTNNTNNTYVIDNSNKVKIRRQLTLDNRYDTIDSNKYVIPEDSVRSSDSFAGYNQEVLAKEVICKFGSASARSTAESAAGFRLLHDGAEFRVRFKWASSEVTGAPFSFSANSNIIPINKPIQMSSAYDVICHFKQGYTTTGSGNNIVKHGKWIEVKREIQYTNGEIVNHRLLELADAVQALSSNS